MAVLAAVDRFVPSSRTFKWAAFVFSSLTSNLCTLNNRSHGADSIAHSESVQDCEVRIAAPILACLLVKLDVLTDRSPPGLRSPRQRPRSRRAFARSTRQ